MDNLELLHTQALQRNVPVIASDGARLLSDEVRRLEPRRILEIGTAVGYSGILMLSAAPDATLLTIELDGERAEEARRNFASFRVADRVRLIEDDASVVLTCLSEPFDFIFLDGPKGQYPSMFKDVLRLLNTDGEIFIDDMSYHGWIEGNDYPKHKHRTIITGLRKFIAELTADSRLNVKFCDVGEGVVLVTNNKKKD